MSCRTPYIKSIQYLVVLDEYGNRIVEYLNQHDTCKTVFERKLNMQYGVDLGSNYQVFVDGKKIR